MYAKHLQRSVYPTHPSTSPHPFSLHLAKAVVLSLGLLQLPASGASRQTPPCVNLPAIPSYATYSIRGWFEARLGCPRADQDIALTTQGDNGVLLCDPHSTLNYELQNVRLPDCHPLKLPKSLHLDVVLSYTLNTCEGPPLAEFKRQVQAHLQTYAMAGNAPCGDGQGTCTPKTSFNCGDNKAYPNSPRPQHIEVRFSMGTDFVMQKGLGFYNGSAQAVRRRLRFATDGSLTDEARTAFAVPGTDLVWGRVSSWRGTCSEYANSHGTDLELDSILTCRGCPVKYYMFRGQCLPCDFGKYTVKPFANRCKKCPARSKWDDVELMEDLCYMRP